VKESTYVRFQRLCAALGVGLLALAGLLLLLSLQPTPALADPGTLFVKPDGTGTACTQDNPCSLQTALTQAADGDTIYVATGTYTGTGAAVITVTKSITLYGGWDGTTATPVVRDLETYPTTLDGENARRVVYISGNIIPTVDGFIITRGDATGLGGGPYGRDASGGVYIFQAEAVIRNCKIYTNTGSTVGPGNGGGLYLYQSNALLEGNTVQGNIASTATWGSGGGLLLWYSDATLEGNIIVTNTASTASSGYGGGVYLYHQSDATLEGNTIVGNSANTRGGGLYLDNCKPVLEGNAIVNNTSNQGGGLYFTNSDATLDGNTIISNTSNQGGGLYFNYSDATLTNTVVADNRANNAGSGLYVRSASPRLLHTTIARNTGGDGSGVHVSHWGSVYSTVVLSNTILVSHSVGITVTAGDTAILEATLWGSGAWANTTDWGGDGTIVTGTVNVWGDPAFVNPDAGDYHLTAVSAAIDRGVDAGVTTDIDGDQRPLCMGYDIGADEFVPIPVDSVGITGPTTGTTGTAYVFTATVAPPTATLPITYTWTPEPGAGQTSPVVTYTWMVTGTKVITVTAENCGGVVSDTHVITISAPPPPCYALTDVDITGPVTGTTGTAYVFTATVAPPTATLPITYTWSPEPDAGQSNPVVTYTWTTTGTKAISVTAENCGGVVSDTHTIIIATPPSTYIYLPLVVKDYP